VTIAGELLVLAGAALLVVAALGLFLLPDALARQHAATKAGTLALGVVLVGVALAGDGWAWVWRAGAIALLLFATLPVSSHMLARAAARELLGSDAAEKSRAEKGLPH
jgi:multicomponent Na+:H+ antiporter subunit G